MLTQADKAARVLIACRKVLRDPTSSAWTREVVGGLVTLPDPGQAQLYDALAEVIANPPD